MVDDVLAVVNAKHRASKTSRTMPDSKDGVQNLGWLKECSLRVARSLMEDNDTIAQLKADKYDLVLRDTLSWPALLPAQILGIPHVDVLTTGVLQPFFASKYSIPNPIAYMPQMTSASPPDVVSGSVQICS